MQIAVKDKLFMQFFLWSLLMDGKQTNCKLIVVFLPIKMY